jgi:NAD dependent epimerase/dehydratase
MLNNSKVLVTGSGGFIGSHLVEALIEAGADVKAFVKYNSRGDVGMLSSLEPEKFNKLEIVNGNITDPFFVKQAVKGCDYVFHLAALIGIPYSYIAPQDYVTTNVVGTLNVLQACLEMDVKRVIHTSTSEAYGTAQYVPIDELHPLQGQSPYSASKIGADKIVESYYKSFELPVVTVRPFNTFGPRQSARAFIPTAVTQVLTSDRIKMGSMYPVRDLTFVKDTVNGFLKVGMCDKALGEVVNLGVGHGDSIGDVVKTILKMLNKEDISIETDDKRVRPEKSEVLELVSNNRKAYDLCGWKPEYSLEKGLALRKRSGCKS